jgi:regulatory protein
LRVVNIARPPRKRYYDVTLDRGGVVRLSPEVLASSALRPGQDLTSGDLQALKDRESRYRALSGALRLLSYRQRSERELRDALRRRSVPDDIIAETMERLRGNGLVNDADFARSYVETRDDTSPRARRLLAAELAARGVGRAERERSLASVDEAQAAYRAGQKRVRTLASAPYADFQRRLSDHLLRRGFGYDIARETVQRLWAETHAGEQVKTPIDE